MTDRSDQVPVLAHQLLRELLAPLPAEVRDEVLRRVLELVADEVDYEKRRCAELCVERADLWLSTSPAGASASQEAQEEARARGNEARYLADLILAEDEEGTADA